MNETIGKRTNRGEDETVESAVLQQLLDLHPDPTDSQIAHYLSGNLCRCAAYPEIIEAVKLAARRRKTSREENR